jgi:acrylyl-CoA reductase (NADPH)
MSNTFKALVLDQQDGKTQSSVRSLTQEDLPQGDVLVQVDYSSINYKDAMAVTGTGKIIRQFPMVPGIDLAGTVLLSDSERFKPGDHVVLTGWGVGERYWGGLSQIQRVKSEWLVPLTQGMSPLKAMTLGTAGLTAMLCVMALQEGGVTAGPVLVTGATGGVGSVAVALLAAMGYQVSALTQRPEQSRAYLTSLGASEVIGGPEWREKPAPLGTQRWAGAIDVVGASPLARILSETRYGGTVTACGLAVGANLDTTVMPFILRGVRLQGVDSVMCPLERRVQAWQLLQTHLPPAALGTMQRVVGLDEVARIANDMMTGQALGRVVVDVNR